MSNVKRSYNTSRRIRKGYKERLNHLMLMRPLRYKTKVLSDEYKIESLFRDQENNILTTVPKTDTGSSVEYTKAQS